MVFFRARAEKGIDDTLTRAAWTFINNCKLAKQISSNCGKIKYSVNIGEYSLRLLRIIVDYYYYYDYY